MTKQSLTVPERLLVAATKLGERKKSFSAEDLVVEAWELYPDTFGLSGFTDRYPDSNRVFTQIMGTKGMRGKGWLRKTGEKQYTLTSLGLAVGDALMTSNREKDITGDSASQRQLMRDVSRALGRLLSTSAAKKALADNDQSISFIDACGFWDLSARSNANTMTHKFADLENTLSIALNATETATESEGQINLQQHSLNTEDVTKLQHLHETLQERFAEELKIIQSRTDERLRRSKKPK